MRYAASVSRCKKEKKLRKKPKANRDDSTNHTPFIRNDFKWTCTFRLAGARKTMPPLPFSVCHSNLPAIDWTYNWQVGNELRHDARRWQGKKKRKEFFGSHFRNAFTILLILLGNYSRPGDRRLTIKKTKRCLLNGRIISIRNLTQFDLLWFVIVVRPEAFHYFDWNW